MNTKEKEAERTGFWLESVREDLMCLLTNRGNNYENNKN